MGGINPDSFFSPLYLEYVINHTFSVYSRDKEFFWEPLSGAQ